MILTAHNITARYVFNLSADRILPTNVLSTQHHGSPHVASVATSGVALLLNAAIGLPGVEPLAFYTAVLGVTSMIALVIISICNVAVFLYMRRHGGRLSSTRATVVCPIFTAVGLGSSLVLAAINFPMLVGGSREVAAALLMVILGLFVLCFNSRAVPEPESPHVQQHRTSMMQMRIAVAQRVALMRRPWKTTTYSEDT